MKKIPESTFRPKRFRPAFAAVSSIAGVVLISSVTAVPISKYANTSDLFRGASWMGSVAPGTADIATFAVKENGVTGVHQWIDSNGDGKSDKLVFQVDSEATRKMKIISVESPTIKSSFPNRPFGRLVTERLDDVAWENDLVAFRTSGKTLEKDFVSSGIDVGAKRARELLFTEWHQASDAFYHTNNRKGLDFDLVKRSRDCGGAGIRGGTKMHASRNLVSYGVIANGPIGTQFESTCDPWDVNGVKVSEINRFTFDSGSSFYRVESDDEASDELRDIDVAVGIAKHEADFDDKKVWLTAADNMSHRAASPLVVSVATPEYLQKIRSEPLSQRLANTLMNRVWLEDDGTPIGIPARWTYEQGVQFKAIEQVWDATGDPKYFDFIKRGADYWLDKEGKLSKYNLEEYNIDHITPGRGYVTLYRVTKDKRYKEASELIRSQLKTHPRTKEGGFWHKKIYPWQMWLDGLYMAQPFYAEYSMVWNEDNWDDIANQFVWMEEHARDPKTGLLYHGWDESREQKWANKETGLSPHVWGRAMGWYAIALIDTLDYFPKNHPRRQELIAILNREAEAIARYQDKKTGVWYDIIDLAERPKNYIESSATAMFVYSLAKGVRKGYLPEIFLETVKTGWVGIKKEFIKELPDGNLDWEGTVSVSGLGGNPYRDGSFDYYMSEKLRTNDVKGLGPAVMAAVEMEHLARVD